MADLKAVKARIAEIAGRPKNVDLSDVEWVITHLGNNGYDVAVKRNVHQVRFTVNKCQFGICCHNRGNRQIKAHYVDEFLDAMTEIGVYED